MSHGAPSCRRPCVCNRIHASYPVTQSRQRKLIIPRIINNSNGDHNVYIGVWAFRAESYKQRWNEWSELLYTVKVKSVDESANSSFTETVFFRATGVTLPYGIKECKESYIITRSYDTGLLAQCHLLPATGRTSTRPPQPGRESRCSIYQPRRDRTPSWPGWLLIYRDVLLVGNVV